MKYTASEVNLITEKTDCLVVPAFDQKRSSDDLADDLAAIDKASKGYIKRYQKQGDLTCKVGNVLMLHNVPGIKAERLLLIGCGYSSQFDERAFLKAAQAMVANLAKTPAKQAILSLTHIVVKSRDLHWKIRQLVEIVHLHDYQFQGLKSEKLKKKHSIAHIMFNVKSKDTGLAKQAIKEGQNITDGMIFTKDLANQPANVCTPTYLAKQAQNLGKKFTNLKVKVIEETEMKRLGMGALLSVSQGSKQPAKLIVMDYRGGKGADAPVVLVGKGITFDSGGISLKPPRGMENMKFDMCGAASVFGTLKAICEMRLAINVVGLIPTSENLPTGTPTKPGDVVKSMSGQTIEINNTDAEGRLIMCDTLTYAERFKPRFVIDIATLTGAIIISLGREIAGLFTNDDTLANKLEHASDFSHDRIWRMPIAEEYQSTLDSHCADIANIGGDAGSITAACFLSRFAKKFKWAHIDIAGVAWKEGKQKGATARPVPLLTQFLLNLI